MGPQSERVFIKNSRSFQRSENGGSGNASSISNQRSLHLSLVKMVGRASASSISNHQSPHLSLVKMVGRKSNY